MPDIVNSGFNDTTAPTMPDIPVIQNFDYQPVPLLIDSLKNQFTQIPTTDVPIDQFNSLVNQVTTPPQQKEDVQRQNAINSVVSQASVGMTPLPKSLPETYFKTSDAFRYKQNDRLWTTIGYNPNISQGSMDAQYQYAQTAWESFKNEVPKLWATASFGFTNYYQTYADTVKAIGNLDTSYLYNSPRFTDYNQNLKDLEDQYPNYQSDRPSQWYDFLPFSGGAGEFYKKQLGTIAFIGGTLLATGLENAAITAATEGMGEAFELPNSIRKVINSIGDYYSAGRAATLVKSVIGAKSILGGIKPAIDIWRLENSAQSMVALNGATNASDYMNSYKESYISDHGYAPGALELATAQKAANSIALSTIGWQLPFMIMAESVQFGNIIAPKTIASITKAMGMSEPFTLGIIDKIKGTVGIIEPEAKTLGSKILIGLKGPLVFGTQNTYFNLTTTAIKDYYNDKYLHQDNTSIMKSIGTGFNDILSDKGLEEFVSGFISGGIMQYSLKPFTRWLKPQERPDAERYRTNPDTGEKIDIGKYKISWLNRLGIGMTDTITKDMQREQLQPIVDHLNSADVDKVFMSDGFRDIVQSKKRMFALAKYVENNDLFNIKNTQLLELHDMLWRHLETGRIDLGIERLQDWTNNHTFDELTNIYGDELKTTYSTKEDQDAFMSSLKSFGEGLKEKGKEFEKIYNYEKGQHKGIMQGTEKELNDAINKKHYEITNLYKKYGEDDVENKVTDEERLNIRKLDENIKALQIRRYAVNEAIKASVFSQVGMREDSKRAKDTIYQLMSKNTPLQPYTDLGSVFDKGYRETRLEQLRVNSEGIGSTDVRKEQYKQFSALSDILDRQFNTGKQKKYDVNNVADALQNYYQSIRTELEKKDNNTPLSNSMKAEEADQFNSLKDFIKLQNQHQENLNLYNYLSNTANRGEYINQQSKAITDFLDQVISKQEAQSKPPEPTAAPEFKIGDTTYPNYVEMNNALDKGEITIEQFNNAVDSYNNLSPEKAEKKPIITSDVIEVQKGNIVNPDKALASDSLQKSVMRQSMNTDAQGNPVPDEQNTLYSKITAEKYDQELSHFIVNQYPTVIKSGMWKGYMVKDNIDLQKRLKSPEDFGEVIVLKDINGKYKLTNEGLPVVISFNEFAFDKDIEERIAQRNRDQVKMGLEPDSKEYFENQKKMLVRARQLLKEGKMDNIELNLHPIVMGAIHETTLHPVPVAERFTNFKELRILKNKEVIGGEEFQAGDSVAIIKNPNGEEHGIKIFTPKIRDVADLRDNIQTLFTQTYTDKGDARKAIAYFDNILYLKAGRNEFKIIGDGKGNFKLEYYKDGEKGSAADLLNSRVNTKQEALDKGYTKISPAGKGISSEEVSKEDYRKWLNSQLLTNRKIVYGKDYNTGVIDTENLHFAALNPYVTFDIVTPIFPADEAFSTEATPIAKPIVTPEAKDIEAKKPGISDEQFNELKKMNNEEMKTKVVSLETEGKMVTDQQKQELRDIYEKNKLPKDIKEGDLKQKAKDNNINITSETSAEDMAKAVEQKEQVKAKEDEPNTNINPRVIFETTTEKYEVEFRPGDNIFKVISNKIPDETEKLNIIKSLEAQNFSVERAEEFTFLKDPNRGVIVVNKDFNRALSDNEVMFSIVLKPDLNKKYEDFKNKPC